MRAILYHSFGTVKPSMIPPKEKIFTNILLDINTFRDENFLKRMLGKFKTFSAITEMKKSIIDFKTDTFSNRQAALYNNFIDFYCKTGRYKQQKYLHPNLYKQFAAAFKKGEPIPYNLRPVKHATIMQAREFSDAIESSEVRIWYQIVVKYEERSGKMRYHLLERSKTEGPFYYVAFDI